MHLYVYSVPGARPPTVEEHPPSPSSSPGGNMFELGLEESLANTTFARGARPHARGLCVIFRKLPPTLQHKGLKNHYKKA